jgi:hypothetical protein
LIGGLLVLDLIRIKNELTIISRKILLFKIPFE